MKKHAGIWLWVLLFSLVGSPAWAQFGKSPEAATSASVSASIDESVATDAGGTLVLTVEVPEGWHIYSAVKEGSIPAFTKFKLAEDAPIQLKSGIREPDPIFKDDLYYHEGTISFEVPFAVKSGIEPGNYTVSGEVLYQLCNDEVCLQNDGASFSVTLQVEEGGSADPRILVDGVLKADGSDAGILDLVITIPDGWHIYSAVKNSEDVPNLSVVTLRGDVKPTAAVQETEPNRHSETWANGHVFEYFYHKGTVHFQVPVSLPQNFDITKTPVEGFVTYMLCNDETCLPEAVADFSITATAELVDELSEGVAPPRKDELEKRGFLGFILFAMGGGLLSLMMPCVYPLIPITLSYFVKQSDGSKGKTAMMAWAYAAGIILTFVGVGFLFTVLLGADGPRIFAANKWVNLAIAALFFYFAFSLFGLYEIKLPSFITNAASGSSPRQGVGGAFVLGLAFAVVTFTCVIPIAAALLTVASEGDKFAGTIAMLAYSVTMASPFIVIGVFPGLVASVPRGGGWMNTVKIVAGFLEIALAAQYLANADLIFGWGIVTRTILLTTWIAVCVMCTLYLLGVFRMKDDPPDAPVGVGRAMTALVFISLAIYLSRAFVGGNLGSFETVLVPESAGSHSTSSFNGRKAMHVADASNLNDALARAKAEDKPVFIEFTGVT
jgi:thiol:disulfide interchange protein DsbD